MSLSLSGRYFLTGTDTEVGKSLVCASLLNRVKNEGGCVQGLKPIAAGCEYNELERRWENQDALLLQHVSSRPMSYEALNPVALPNPCSPHLAAAMAGVEIDPIHIASMIKENCWEDADLILVEGAGGWFAPIQSKKTMADLAVSLGFPVLMVVGLRLGCLNHAYLTQQAIKSSGLKLAGWFANHCTEGFADAAENIAWLSEALGAPCLGEVSYQRQQTGQSSSDSFLGYPVISSSESMKQTTFLVD